MADGIFPVDIGPQYEGEVIRKADMRVELGGPNVKTKFEMVSIKQPNEVTHEKVEVIGSRRVAASPSPCWCTSPAHGWSMT
jgi:acetyl-CoA synthase